MHYLLIPISWIYGLVIAIRNHLFDKGVLHTKQFDLPVISVGNISMCGTGKTPHTEYLLEMLAKSCKVAMLSRGYMRKTKGYVLADEKTDVHDIGDEAYQVHQKFPQVTVAVCENRCYGIERLIEDEEVEAVVLDDAYQHRYVKPGINILLVDSTRLIGDDMLLPAGTLREPQSAKKRADIVIVTKCSPTMSPIDIRVITNQLRLLAFQELFFTRMKYLPMYPAFDDVSENQETTDDSHAGTMELEEIRGKNVLLLTAIGSQKHIIEDLKPYGAKIMEMSYRDHHQFSESEIYNINERFNFMTSPKIAITTEKDYARIKGLKGFSDEMRKHLYVLPIKVEFMLDKEDKFNKIIKDYVHKNPANNILAERKDDDKPENSDNTGDGIRSISFRDN